MKTEVKKIDSTKREINIEVSGDIVKDKFESVFREIEKDAKVKGFRPGHVPRDILEKHYSNAIYQQVTRELVPDIYHQAIDKEKLEVVHLPQIYDIKLDRDRLSFKAMVEVSPKIEIKDYKGIKLKFKKVDVAADEVKRNLDSLKESRKVNSLDDGFAKGLGYPNLIELEKAIERQIFIQKENNERQRLENEIIESLIKSADFQLPQSLVEHKLQDLIKQTKLDLALKGIPKEKIDEQDSRLKKELEPEAKRQVKIYLVLAEIAKRENIPLDNQMSGRVMEFLFREANWQEEV